MTKIKINHSTNKSFIKSLLRSSYVVCIQLMWIFLSTIICRMDANETIKFKYNCMQINMTILIILFVGKYVRRFYIYFNCIMTFWDLLQCIINILHSISTRSTDLILKQNFNNSPWKLVRIAYKPSNIIPIFTNYIANNLSHKFAATTFDSNIYLK